MASVKLDTVRSGVKLLSGVLKEADLQNNEDGKVTSREIKDFKDSYGDGASLDKAMTAVHKYAQAKYGVTNPTEKQINSALADAMKYTARADINGSKDLSPTERRALSATWEAVVKFAIDYKGSSVRDIVSPSSAP